MNSYSYNNIKYIIIFVHDLLSCDNINNTYRFI